MDFNALFKVAEEQTAPHYPKLDCEGTWLVRVLEASYGKAQKSDAMRTQLKVEVVQSIGDTADRTGARCSVYLTVHPNNDITERNFAPYIKCLLDLGIPAEKITEDAVDYFDIAQNISVIITKQIKLQKEILFELQLKQKPNSQEFYKNIFAHKSV